MKQLLLMFFLMLFKIFSYIPIIGGFFKDMHSSILFGRASGFYYGKKYEKAIDAYNKALDSSQGMENIPPLNIAFENAYVALGKMHEKGLGVEKDEMKAEEYYLQAGSREMND